MCHAWSCTPTALLSEQVLGVTYDAVTKSAAFTPKTLGLKWAQGIAPLACGDITARWEVKDGTLVARVSTPRGIRLSVELPGRDGGKVIVNEKNHGTGVANGIYRQLLDGGDYEITIPQA